MKFESFRKEKKSEKENITSRIEGGNLKYNISFESHKRD